MTENIFRRHDLVWLAPDYPLSALALPPLFRAHAERWIARRLPFVVARQDAATSGLRLGFTIPGTGVRQRVGVLAPQAAVVRHDAAPLLTDLLTHVPRHWRDGLDQLLHDFSNIALVPRVFGSLVTEVFSGEPCLRPDSDLDLLLACSVKKDIDAALSVLRRHDQRSPRVDAELRMPDGRAVSWRELERAVGNSDGAGAQVLVKSDAEVRMMCLDSFIGCRQ